MNPDSPAASGEGWEPLRVAVLGAGHVGLATAACLAKIGHQVVGMDADRAKVASLSGGRTPFFEPGLQEIVEEGLESGRLMFTADTSEALSGAQAAFICVGTPGGPDGTPMLGAVERAAEAVGVFGADGAVVVEKSTVPVHTAERICRVLERMARGRRFHVVSNPEFLREGRAVEDFLRPARILVGADDRRSHEIMRRLYEPLVAEGAAYFATDVCTAELAKHACNVFLALKISFANALAPVCEAAGADVVAVADIMGSDPRIGRDFLEAGMGFGGYCLPKDVAAFKAQTERLGCRFGLLDEIIRINEYALAGVFEKVRESLWNLQGKRVALLGLAFKPDTDDVRSSPALRLAERLMDAGARVVAHDPRAAGNACKELSTLNVADDAYEAAEGADCIVICTAWPEYRSLDLARLKGVMRQPVLVDGRNLFDLAQVSGAGFDYLPTGRPRLSS